MAHLHRPGHGPKFGGKLIFHDLYVVSGYTFSDKLFFEKSIVASFKFELFKRQLNANDSV